MSKLTKTILAEAANEIARLSAELASIRADAETVESEQARWQSAIYELLKGQVPRPHELDGAGCESGDPLDGTLAEISQAFNQISDDEFDAEAAVETVRGLERLLETRVSVRVEIAKIATGIFVSWNDRATQVCPSLASAIAAAVETAKDGE